MPVCDPGRTEGGGVTVALYQRPTLAVTSVPAESQQRIPIGYAPKGWCPSDVRTARDTVLRVHASVRQRP